MIMEYREFRDTVAPPWVCNRKEAQSRYKTYKIEEEKKKMFNTIVVSNGSSTETIYYSPGHTILNGWSDLLQTTTDCSSEKTVEKETAMTYEQNTRDYLLRRLEAVGYELERKLPDQFNLYVNNTPKTYKELIDAIKNDKFKLNKHIAERLEDIDDGEDDEDYLCGPFDGIIWDGPQPDRKGRDAAYKSLCAAKTAAKDIIMTSDPKDAVEALKALEAWVPAGAAN